MKYLIIAGTIIGIFAFWLFKYANKSDNLTILNKNTMKKKQDNLKNDTMKVYPFLKCMYSDAYFPKHLVDKGKDLLVDLCFQIEAKQPENLDELYELTQAATGKFNDLEDEFIDNDSEIETGARECIAEDFGFIATSYGFEADVEELIATRNW